MRLPQCLQALQNRLGKPLFDLFVVATVCLCLYSSGLNGPFLHDDIKAVLENPDVQVTAAFSGPSFVLGFEAGCS